MTQVKSSFGTLLQMGDGGSPESFTTIAEVLDISGPGISRDTEEVTNHSSPNGWEEFIATIGRSGEVTFDVNFLPTHATHDGSTGLIAAVGDGQLHTFRQVLSTTGRRWEYSALVVGFEPSAPVIGRHQASVTLKVSGKPALVANP